ncbi:MULTISPECIES: ABC transporter permease [Saliphagus]|uniref:ABC transporter permease n=1 Tax=Saliphagus infecundisoli TaxID=1849069 RepID=A0ABD5Q9R1_9EURY
MNYYVRRIGQAIVTLFSVITITFVLYRLMPGGPLDIMRQQMIQEAVQQGQDVNVEQVNRMIELRTNVDPQQPVYQAYAEYMINIVVYQDFGESIWRGEPVFDILFRAMPWSIFVSIYGLLIGFTLNILLGAVMAYKEGSRFDAVASIGATFLNSVPYYVGAILMLSFLGFQFGWFPTRGRYDPATVEGFNLPFMLSVLHHSALPIASTIIVGFGGTALSMRGNCIRVMGQNYLRVARLRGLSDNRIAIRYVGRNAILPLYTSFMIGIAAIFSSSIIMEQIFTYPGIGWYTFEALSQRDYPLLMGLLIFFSTITVIGIMIADLTYGLIDPRAGTSDRESY